MLDRLLDDFGTNWSMYVGCLIKFAACSTKLGRLGPQLACSDRGWGMLDLSQTMSTKFGVLSTNAGMVSAKFESLAILRPLAWSRREITMPFSNMFSEYDFSPDIERILGLAKSPETPHKQLCETSNFHAHEAMRNHTQASASTCSPLVWRPRRKTEPR